MRKPQEHSVRWTSSMVQAYFAGRKTQMRMPVKPQPESGSGLSPCEWYRPAIEGRDGELKDGPEIFGFYNDDEGWRSPFGGPGDLVWVQECWAVGRSGDSYAPRQLSPHCGTVQYRAGGGMLHGRPLGRTCFDVDGGLGKWRPSIHMPRWASRIPLEVIRAWRERLQDIDTGDVVAEGAEECVNRQVRERYGMASPSRTGFAGCWDALNKKRGFGWDSNPLVWAGEFRRLE